MLEESNTILYNRGCISHKGDEKLKNKYIRLVIIILPILAAIICLAQMIKNNNQASMPIPREFTFIGEYSYDGVNWYTYNEDSDISALEGDVIVKGHFDAEITEGGMLNIYCNHIGASLYVNGELLFIDTPSEIKNYGIDLMASMCGKRWEQTLCPQITTEDEVEFRFINFHNHGNKTAYKEALSSLLITPPDNTILEAHLETYTKPLEMTGYALLIVAVMLLGAAFSAILFKSSMANTLFKMGITTLFVAGYIVFDVMITFFMGELLVIKTYGSLMCMMLAVYFIGIIICDALKGKYKNIAGMIMCGSTIINLIIIVLATTRKALLYDMMFFWEVSQYIISIGLIVLCVFQIKSDKKFRKEFILYIGVNFAILIDIVGVTYSMYYSDICFKVAYVISLLLFLFHAIRQVIMDHQASIRNKKLKAELEQSRISIMLSQIQPHFLYNSLTSVMDLCDSNPKQAKAAIADFADYLRGNLSSLKAENLISFGTELDHIEKYLRLEKLRFMDELEIVYDIHSKDFMLPALSVQPLVENAVKHGVGKKIGGGTVTIHTAETDNEYIIRVTDNGVGFVEGEYAKEDGAHVGIENTKKRLDIMVNARLEIMSKKGEGTKATILIPKRRD